MASAPLNNPDGTIGIAAHVEADSATHLHALVRPTDVL